MESSFVRLSPDPGGDGTMIDANPARDLGFGELDDDLNIVIPSLKGPCEVFRAALFW